MDEQSERAGIHWIETAVILAEAPSETITSAKTRHAESILAPLLL